MNLKQLFADEDAVSPVIGVILMVAITVILAAVIGTFVLGLGENVQDSAPQANFQFEYSGDFTDTDNPGIGTVSITHTGGEDVDGSTLSIQIGDETAWDSGTYDPDTTNIWAEPGTGSKAWGTGGSTNTVSTGDTQEVVEDSTNSEDNRGETVRVVWTSASGGTSNTIGQSTIPS